MKWTDDRSGNVDDRRGSGGGGAIVGGGLGTIIIAAIVFFLGGDPSAILSSGGNSAPRTEQRELNQNELQVGELNLKHNQDVELHNQQWDLSIVPQISLFIWI